MINTFNIIVGFGICFLTFEAMITIPGIETIVKAGISIAAGFIGALLSYYLDKWLVKKNSK
jgi:hypothetical protein